MQFFKRFMAMFTPEQRRRYVWIQVYFLFAGFVQVAGMASVAPFIALISSPGLIHSNAAAHALYTRFGFSSNEGFLVAIAVVLMLLIVASNVVFAGAVWFISAFSLRLGVEIQRDIYRGFLHREYAEFSRVNSASLISVLTQDSMRFVYMVVQPVLTLTSQAVIVALIVLGLIWYDPTVALAVALLIGGGYLYVFRLVRRRLETSGAVLTKQSLAKYRILNESLGGIKEIKLLGTERLYEERLNTANTAGIRAGNVVGLLGDLPRFVLEPTALCALLGLGIWLLSREAAPQAIVGTLSLYAVAGYKLLPAAQSVFKSASTIRANGALLDKLLPNIEDGRAVPPAPDITPEPMRADDIHFERVWYAYPGTKSPVIKDVSITIPQNRVTVIVGPSGAGKSTLADLILGLLTPTAGVIHVGDRSIAEARGAWQRALGYVPQNIFLLDDSIAANIALGSPARVDMVKVRRAAAFAKIDEFIDSLPERYDYVVGERGALLSGGQKQRISIARALYHEAEVLVLDEATSSLDSMTEGYIIDTISELKRTKTIVMVAHHLASIKAADQVILMNEGRVLRSGDYNDMMKNSREFRDLVATSYNEERGVLTA